ncbi:hypothetical protein LQW54_004273 [Pestalotiopsis sp. IQ-011]
MSSTNRPGEQDPSSNQRDIVDLTNGREDSDMESITQKSRTHAYYRSTQLRGASAFIRRRDENRISERVQNLKNTAAAPGVGCAFRDAITSALAISRL